MNKTTRLLVAAAGFTTLAATSQATIVLTPLDASVQTNVSSPGQGIPANEADVTPIQLSNGVFGPGTTTDTGGFIGTSTLGLSSIEVNEVSGFATGAGTLSLTVFLNGTQVLYSDATSLNNPLTLSSISPVAGDKAFVVTYVASFTGVTSSDYGALGGFSVDAFEAVPEPTSVVAFGIGVIGLIARRRRSGK